MWGMTQKSLREHLDEARIVRAIQAAEISTSGEIRISVAPFFVGDVQKTAQKAFRRMGMEATKDRNGILIFLVPSRKRFAVVGDEGIHAKVGQAFWNDLVACLSDHFSRLNYTEGLERGITLLGERLAEHFPYQKDSDKDELPNEVDFSGS